MNRRGFLRLIGSGLTALGLVGVPLPLLERAHSFFRSGSDGDAVGFPILTRDMHYENLVIGQDDLKRLNGFRVFVRGSCTFTMDGSRKLTG